jgi:hypothetical protein
MSSIVSGTRSMELQHITDDFGPFLDPYFAGTYLPFTCLLSLLLLALPITAFAGHGNARRLTITEAFWVGATLLSAGEYEVKWGGPGSVQVSFLRGNQMTVTARVMAAVAQCPHNSAGCQSSAITESAKALEEIAGKGRVVDI